MLGAIALDRIVYGLVLVIAFSTGLAGVLTGIGIVLVCGRRVLEGSGRVAALKLYLPTSPYWLQALPLASALVIVLAGVFLTGRALNAL